MRNVLAKKLVRSSFPILKVPEGHHGAQPSARLSEEISLSEGLSGGLSEALRGLSGGSPGVLRGSAAVRGRIFCSSWGVVTLCL